MGITCPCCGTKTVRHIKQPITLRDGVAFDGPFPDEWKWAYWDKDEWWTLDKPTKRVILPIKEMTYEEGVAQYTYWVNECRKAKEQLLVLFVDLGLVRGGENTPWIGSVLLGAFRGVFLDDIEHDVDDDMLWIKFAYRFAAEPKLCGLSLNEMNSLIREIRDGGGSPAS